MPDKLTEIEDAGQFRDLVEARRQEAKMGFRPIARKAGVAHGTYWVWLRIDPGKVTLENALAYAKALGLKLFIGKDDTE
ncbi:hypothetical protein [Rhizobium favelukesii]|uniref:Conserved protein n=1 Tax=Rhizobium favelukesii TaxID=348824 RepID=W6R918_9HYPH|nr:hypothetical protein [Rhizobium favelukesii]MCS0459284.1 hypothetical protein [Rhizobium favelukesii]CDM57414.1 putative conserved protein [Rhizobium favelukesii]